MFYLELFSSDSIYKLAEKHLAVIEEDKELSEKLGKPIRVYNGTRLRLPSNRFEESKKSFLQTSFPITGSKLSGQVELTMIKNIDEEWDTWFLKVTIPGTFSKILVQPPAIFRPKENVFDRIFKWVPNR